MATQLNQRPIIDTSPRVAAALRGAAVLAVAFAIVGVLLGGGGSAGAPGHGSGMMRRGPLPADVRGTYLVDGTEYVTLTGTLGMPMYELRGERVMLRMADEDEFVAWDDHDEVLTLDRDADGVVTGLRLERPGQPALFAARAPHYVEQDVTFANGAVTLAGSIVLPEGDGPHPAVVIVHGAEMATRESYRLHAYKFALGGVAALIFDKRGVGQSTGSFSGATFDDLAGDLLAGVDLLRQQPAIDAQRVGVMGISQAGWTMAKAAATSPDINFLIPVSPSGFSPAIQDRWLTGNILAHKGLGDGSIHAAEKGFRMLLSTRELVDAGVMPAMPGVMGFWFHALDPNLDTAALWESVPQPVLGIWGEFDCQVPAYASMQAVRDALLRGGNDRYALHVLPRADHSITLVGPCAQEASGWNVVRFSHPDSYFRLMTEWVIGLPGTARPDQPVVVPDAPAPSRLGWHHAPVAGVAWYGSVLPQLAVVFGLLVVFAALGLPWLVRRVVGFVLGRRPAADPVGRAGLVGLLAIVMSVVAIVEVLFMGDIGGLPLIGAWVPLGMTVIFMMASLLALLTVVLAIALALPRLRAWRAGEPLRRPSVREGVALAALAVFAAWAAYWNLIPPLSFIG